MTEKLHLVCPQCRAVNRVPSERLADQPRCGTCKQALFDGKPLPVDDAGFAAHVQNSDLPVVVDFWAPWCGPCRQMAPAFEAAAARLEPRVRFLKLNTDEAQQAAGQLGIRSIPTLILFKGGRELARQAGAMPAGALMSWIQQHL